MKIHQIWIGDTVPEHVLNDTDDIQARASLNGHTYKMWNESALLATVDDTELKEAMARARERLPISTYSSMLTDYFRCSLLDADSVYLDTDVVIRMPEGEWPKMHLDPGLYTCSEQTRVTNMNTCCLFAIGEDGAKGAAIAATEAGNELKRRFSERKADETATAIREKAFGLINFIGPGFFRNTSVPKIRSEGVTVQRLDHAFCSSHDPRSLFFHLGEGSWCHNGNGNPKYNRDKRLRNTGKPVRIHQIWVGDPMPAKEYEFTTQVETWCEQNGVEYKLWDEDALRREFPDEKAMWKLYDTLDGNWTVKPGRRYALLSDYFRLFVLEPGDMYLDTDVRLDGDPKVDFDGNKIMCMGEFWNKEKASTGIIAVQDRCNGMKVLRGIARDRAGRITPDMAVKDLPSTFGPRWLRRVANALGGSAFLEVLSDDVAACVEFESKPGWKAPALVHVGSGSWL